MAVIVWIEQSGRKINIINQIPPRLGRYLYSVIFQRTDKNILSSTITDANKDEVMRQPK